jgi:receptor protein-tyrosine kinase
VTPQLNALSDQESALKTQLGQLQLSSSVQTGASQVVTPAAVPTSPSSPRIARNALVAAAVGLLLGVGLAFLRDYLDDSVKTKDDLERAAGVPVLGLIPSVGNWKDPSTTRIASLVEPASHVAEAYRALRTSIQFAGMDRPIRRLQLTSPSAEEGKTATTANLGVALAAAGQRVTIVCCDLRRPRIHEFFGLSDRVGLTSVLLGQATAVEACQRVPHQDRLCLLASGPLPTNPSEVLQSAPTGAMLETLESQADILLLDCPPVLPVTDAAAVSRHVDACLLIVSAEGSHARLVARALEILRQVGAPVLGSVLNKVATDGAYGYPYKYRYYQPALHRTGLDGAYAQGNGGASAAGVPETSTVSPTPPPPHPGSSPQHE